MAAEIDWNPDQYLKFMKERTQPSLDLVARIHLESPSRIVDIGCGPGNSTVVLKNRWLDAEIIGLDSSEAMLKKAVTVSSNIRWIKADVSDDLSRLGRFDIIFSNAALHHLPDKSEVIARLFHLLGPGGVLAFQVPDTRELPFAIELQNLVSSEKWSGLFTIDDYSKKFLGYARYYEILSDLTDNIELWQTDYIQTLSSHAEIVQWYKGSGMRYYLSQLQEESQRLALEANFQQAVERVYPKEKNGTILMPIRRLFFIAHR